VLAWGATSSRREANPSTRVLWTLGVGVYLVSFAAAYAMGLG
jgi:hypothetical protein